MSSRNGQESQPGLSSILQALADTGRPLTDIPLDGLSDLNTSDLELFQSTWRALPAERQRTLISSLVEMAEDHVGVCYDAIFTNLLQDENPWVRMQSIEGLWESEDVRLIPPLIDLMQYDDTPEVRAAAALSLGRFLLLGELNKVDQQAAGRVENALMHSFDEREFHVTVRRRILESLAYSSHERIRDLILSSYDDEDDDMRTSALFAMGRSADPTWQAFVLAELASTDDAIRFEAARASGELELAEAIPYLLDMLDEEDVEIRDAALWALGRIGGKAALRALRACAESEDEALREIAEDALDELLFLSN
ncbi:MAG: HEAT repeat domain-containing protein [Chloroflexota bacterium]|nr:HEAT repeat domain-containing protein [Chloroflexota bacterium]